MQPYPQALLCPAAASSSHPASRDRHRLHRRRRRQRVPACALLHPEPAAARVLQRACRRRPALLALSPPPCRRRMPPRGCRLLLLLARVLQLRPCVGVPQRLQATLTAAAAGRPAGPVRDTMHAMQAGGRARTPKGQRSCSGWLAGACAEKPAPPGGRRAVWAAAAAAPASCRSLPLAAICPYTQRADASQTICGRYLCGVDGCFLFACAPVCPGKRSSSTLPPPTHAHTCMKCRSCCRLLMVLSRCATSACACATAAAPCRRASQTAARRGSGRCRTRCLPASGPVRASSPWPLACHAG
jgi:hypothetical protein